MTLDCAHCLASPTGACWRSSGPRHTPAVSYAAPLPPLHAPRRLPPLEDHLAIAAVEHAVATLEDEARDRALLLTDDPFLTTSLTLAQDLAHLAPYFPYEEVEVSPSATPASASLTVRAYDLDDEQVSSDSRTLFFSSPENLSRRAFTLSLPL